MDIKKFLIFPFILLLFLTSAHAGAAKKPCYIAEGTYDANEHTYTVDVYLDTADYIAAGTFGMEFDENISPVWNDGGVDGENAGYLQINTDYFTLLEPALFAEARSSLENKKYMVVMWGMNEANAANPVRGKLPLGTVTVKNVTLNEDRYPEGWSDKPFRLLNWNDTDFAKDYLFTRKDDNDEASRSINEEIWRDITAAEKAELGAGAPEGYYQGFIFDTDGNSEQTDIDFEFTSDIEYPSMVISGRVEGYNPKNTVQITAYSIAGEAYAAEIAGYAIYADGRVAYDYTIKVPENGKYTLVYKKQSHLTYAAEVTVEDKTTEIPDTLKLICGDINGDGCIKYPDRACLIRFFNRQKSWDTYNEQFDKADLNGDELVNLFDLNILNANMDRFYQSDFDRFMMELSDVGEEAVTNQEKQTDENN